MERDRYEREKYALQIELLKFQDWAQETGTKHVILFEGRDAAGKGGTIKRFTEHLNPRAARVVALTKPSETERGQWYFHRYVAHLPTAGEMVLLDDPVQRGRRRAGDGLLQQRAIRAIPAPCASVRRDAGRERYLPY
jgi:polyphosphate kinase 2 (PPK2 family)